MCLLIVSTVSYAMQISVSYASCYLVRISRHVFLDAIRCSMLLLAPIRCYALFILFVPSET